LINEFRRKLLILHVEKDLTMEQITKELGRSQFSIKSELQKIKEFNKRNNVDYFLIISKITEKKKFNVGKL